MDYCYWRMPFRKSGVFTVENEGNEDVMLKYRFAYIQGDIPDNAAYFHAKWRREVNSPSFDYPLLECDGSAGVFVGDILSVDVFLKKWWGEGSEKIFVDSEEEASTFGTGTEDYFGDAWGIRWFVNALHGCPQNEGRKQLMYRWHISDSIPFSKSFRFVMENHSALHDDFRNVYTSVAYWYQLPGGKDFFPGELPPPEERRPSPEIVMPYALEAERILADEPAAEIVEDASRYSWGRAVTPKSPSNRLQFKLEITSEDVYRIDLFEEPSKLLSRRAFPLTYNGRVIEETVHLKEGEHILTVDASDQAESALVLDYVTLTPHHRFITDWLIVGPFDNDEDKGYDAIYPPEENLDFATEYDVKSGTAKWKKVLAHRNGVLNLDKCFYPNDWVVAYAYTEIISPKAFDTEILVGSDDGVKVWLNGELVHHNHVHRPCTPDEDRAKITLKKGNNTLLLKVDDGITDWGLAARIVDFESVLRFKLPTD
jgi:hypothetical protein